MNSAQLDPASYAAALRRSPLHDIHVAHGARMDAFAGWSMPIHYPLGILGEHLHTRTRAGLFDVSHMGQIIVQSHSGLSRDVALALESLIPVDLLTLPPGRQRYGFLTNAAGGIHDDLMIANLGSWRGADACWYLVVNAACASSDLAYLQAKLADQCSVKLLTERALLAIQGPQACAVLSALVPTVATMRFMDAAVVAIDGTECFVTRSGYTGEDGFELSVPSAAASRIVERLLAFDSVRLIGLGARDSLRLEAGLCLFGNELTADTTPVEAALTWAIQPMRRPGGERCGGFPGSEVILQQLSTGAPRKRVGLRSDSRPVRQGAPLYADEASVLPVGKVTSGTFGPSAQCPVAMAYVASAQSAAGTHLFADVRGQRVPVTVSDMPFVAHRYHR